MIDNNLFATLKVREITQKETVKDIKLVLSENKNIFKDVLNKEVKAKTSAENNNVTNKELKVENEAEALISEKIGSIVEKIEEIENFPGNEVNEKAIEEIIALLNNLMNSQEFKDIFSQIKTTTSNLVSSLEDTTSSINVNLNSKIIELNEAINSVSNEEIKNINLKEVQNLVSNILEVINSDNFKEVASSSDIKKITESLNKLMEKLPSIEVLNSKVITEDLEANKGTDSKIKSNDETNDTDSSLKKDIISSIKEKVNKDENVQTENESNSKTSKGIVTPEVSKDEKVLLKILDEDNVTASTKIVTSYDRMTLRTVDTIKEPMIVNKQTMDADIIKNVKFMMKNAISELKVKVYPKELGEMTIKILSEEGIMRAEIKATSKETYNLLNSNLNDIKKGLAEQNIKIQEITIALYQDDTTYFSGENTSQSFEEQKNRNANSKGTDNLEVNSLDEIEEVNSNINNNVDLLA